MISGSAKTAPGLFYTDLWGYLLCYWRWEYLHITNERLPGVSGDNYRLLI